uniref:Predicted nucleic acid-binding protein, contains PIN domain n=1 Tax=Candidatus Kentrum eta TaxID=2126337 RepID=A0A450U6I7_9GAMM|nr:MAG: Predicted nucleic acid-binding protein, contains PIN domain [Candidatus Kentron sp. H]VFJ88895.1 MAG: Predicted nucleic acid-binding protein, contains PIN domain [Candidatus Kentron sp. H]VFJ95131.1 MAG: Predicted nucleic acid-binding protein, contains PIN domain [Candidatus Kentron sp. H]
MAVYRKLQEEDARFVTTGAVLLELGNAFSRRTDKNIALQLINAIYQSARWQVGFQDYALMRRGLALFSERQDKNWSLTDCISIVVAGDHEISEVFTSDHHFAQAGFQILLE